MDVIDYGQQVGGVMASFNALFDRLRNSPFVKRLKATEGASAGLDPDAPAGPADMRHKDEFLSLLAQAVPTTDADKYTAAVFDWVMKKNRPMFIMAMFRDHYACVSLLLGGRSIEVGLGIDRYVSLILTEGGYRIDHPRAPADSARPASAWPAPARGGRRGRGGNGRRGRPAGRGRGGPRSGGHHGRAVLDDEAFRSMLSELDRNASSGALGDEDEGFSENSDEGDGKAEEVEEIGQAEKAGQAEVEKDAEDAKDAEECPDKLVTSSKKKEKTYAQTLSEIGDWAQSSSSDDD